MAENSLSSEGSGSAPAKTESDSEEAEEAFDHASERRDHRSPLQNTRHYGPHRQVDEMDLSEDGNHLQHRGQDSQKLQAGWMRYQLFRRYMGSQGKELQLDIDTDELGYQHQHLEELEAPHLVETGRSDKRKVPYTYQQSYFV